MAKESVEELLKQAIAASDRTTAASDRTTFAVRAFVLFLFLQLAFTSIAAVFVWFGYTAYNGFVFVIVGLVVFFLGVIVSSVVGWNEIGMSGVGLGQPRLIKDDYDFVPLQDETSTTKKPNPSKHEPKENDGSRVCSKCDTVYRANVSRCDSCNLWLDPTLNLKS